MVRTKICKTLNSEACIRVMEKAICLCVALLPFLWVYNFPVVNVSVGTVLLFAFVPYALMKIYVGRSKKEDILVLLLLAFYLYLSVRAEGNLKRILLYIPTFFILWAVLKGALPEGRFRKYIEIFACVNAVMIVVQMALYYVFDIKISFIAYSLLQRDYYQTYAGVTQAGSLYRPSGLLLEPAFFSQYALFALISCLFPKNGKVPIKRALLIGIGIVCSTSGMGMVLMVFVLAWFLVFSKGEKKAKLKRIGIACILAVVAVLILSIFPFFREALRRIFSKLDGYNAILGRTRFWGSALRSLNFAGLLFGLGGEHEFSHYLSGLPITIYQYGLIGLALFLGVYAAMMRKTRNNYVWCSCVIFLILFCVARLTGVFSNLFFFCVVMVNVFSAEKEEISEDKQEGMNLCLNDATKITNEELKEISVGILTDVADFCDHHGLRYYLICGTALGAVRHDGFIPWDDDIDIGMPRPDYEKFLTNYQSEKCYLVDSRSGKKYPYAFAKVCDSRTVLIEKIEDPFPMGVYIDVFPMDGIPSDPEKQKKHLRKIDWNLRVISWKRISKEKKLDLLHKAIQTVAKVVLAPIPISFLIKKMERDLKAVDYESSEYIGHLAGKGWGEDRKPKEIFEPPVEHVFENRNFWVPGDYDAYLSLEYGDYMQLPPVEKQVSRHDFVAYWKDETKQ